MSLLRVPSSAQHLADHFEAVPLFLVAFTRGDKSGGSIFPAVWSAQLAARAEGVGGALTSVLGIFHGEEAVQISACHLTRAGRWPASCRSATRPATGASHPGVPSRPSPTATGGELASVSKSTSLCGHRRNLTGR